MKPAKINRPLIAGKGLNPLALAIIGTNGTRKTTDALKLARSVFRAVFFTAEFKGSTGSLERWYKSGGVFYVEPTDDVKQNEKLIGLIVKRFADVVIVIDDLRLWVAGSHRVGYFVARMFARRRHMNQVIIIVGHSLKQLPTEFYDYQPAVYMKKTTGTQPADWVNVPPVLIDAANYANSDKVKPFDGVFIQL